MRRCPASSAFTPKRAPAPRRPKPRRESDAMKFDMTSIDGSAVGSVELSDDVFGLEPRADLIARMVRWQLAKRQAGTHKTLGRAEIHRTGKKMYKQKGTGGARHGSARVPQFRGGGRAMGPVLRSHAHDLPKKVRALALKHALSAKLRDGGIIVWDKAALKSVLIIDGAAVQTNFANAARNIPHVDVLPVQGINVYDIIRREK